MKDVHREAFKEEAFDLLSELEAALLELDERPGDAELVGRVFRALHTIKGSGAMFGFDKTAAFTHELEAAFSAVRDGIFPVTADLVAIALKARDHIKRLLLTEEALDPSEESIGVALLDSLRLLARALEPSEVPVLQDAPRSAEREDPPVAAALTSFRIHFEPGRELFMTGANPLFLVKEVRALGECDVVCHVGRVPTLEDIDPVSCYLSWDLILTTDRRREAIEEIFEFLDGEQTLAIEEVVPSPDHASLRIGEVLVSRGDLAPEALQLALDSRPLLGEHLVNQGLVPREKVASALAEQVHLKAQASRQAAEAGSGIRVSSQKLDMLINLVGELVTVQARLSQIAQERSEPALSAVAEEVERLTWDVRDTALNMRMLPIGSLFSKFKRLVHDLGRQLGKDVDFVVEGGETELDKTVIERLGDPLVHLIRNAMDHGIEAPEARIEAGKSPRGTLSLRAQHEGTHILLRVQDDGFGLDFEAIRRKAIERNLLAASAEVGERELIACLLQAGFSTAGAITEVSGRGVGLDVVNRTIDALQGTLDISSVKGRGTTFSIRLPLTLAIIEGLLVTVGEDSYVLPLASVTECIELNEHSGDGTQRRRAVNLRGSIVPYIRLREHFNIGGPGLAIEQVVIASVGDRQIGFAVDRVVGQIQTVVKQLGRLYKGIEGLSGATILGDGRLALILDVARLIQEAERGTVAAGNREAVGG